MSQKDFIALVAIGIVTGVAIALALYVMVRVLMP